jgi:hypothetical protein
LHFTRTRGVDERVVLIAFVLSIQPSQDHADFIPVLSMNFFQVHVDRSMTSAHAGTARAAISAAILEIFMDGPSECDPGRLEVYRLVARAQPVPPDRITMAPGVAPESTPRYATRPLGNAG